VIRGSRNRLRLVVAVAASAVAVAIASASPSRGKSETPARADAAVREVLDAFDRVQAGIKTLSAGFVETTTSQLLKDPIQSRGRFYLTKPSSVLWEYTEPEEMRFVVANDEYIGYFPQRKRAERSDVHRFSERIFRIFGLGQTSEELSKFYDIHLQDPGPDMKGTTLLVLEPKKRRVRKHVERVRFWVSDATYLPVRFELQGRDDYSRVIQFRDVRVNPDIAASLYVVDIPHGVTVTRGTSGLDVSRARGQATSQEP
jgi:outer membrane lipoprotein-sorting protein